MRNIVLPAISLILLCWLHMAAFAQKDYGSIQNRVGITEHNDPGMEMSLQAQLFCSSGTFDKAEPLFKAALKYWSQHTPVDPEARPRCLNNFGLMYAGQGKYEQAVPLYRDSLALSGKSLPPDHNLVVLATDNLAQAYRAMGKYQDAEPLYKKALALEEKTMVPDDQDHAITMFNLSLLYLQQKRYAECEPLMTRSLSVLKTTLGEDNPDYLNVYKYYPALLRQTGRTPEADRLEEELVKRLSAH